MCSVLKWLYFLYEIHEKQDENRVQKKNKNRVPQEWHPYEEMM